MNLNEANKKNIAIIVTTAIVAFILGIVIGNVSSNGAAEVKDKGFNKEAAKEIIEAVSSDNLRDYLKELTSEPHIAASRRDRSFPISETCISTPLAYKDLFEEIQFNIDVPPQCVSQNLFTTIQGPYGDGCPLNGNPLPPTVSKYATSTWGWASPSINLEMYLAMASRHPFDPFSTVAEMCKYVGFTDDQVHQDCSYTLAVFDREKAKQNGLFAPTWAAWFPRLNDYFGLSFTWEVQKELVLGGFEDFDHLTGCHNRTVAQNALCSPDFVEAWKLCKGAFYDGTEACATRFGSAYGGGLTASAAHTRAFLLACMDANPMFTGVGYGWDGIDYTGPEFLVDNVNLEDDLGAVRFLLYSPSSSRKFHRESPSSSFTDSMPNINLF